MDLLASWFNDLACAQPRQPAAESGAVLESPASSRDMDHAPGPQETTEERSDPAKEAAHGHLHSAGEGDGNNDDDTEGASTQKMAADCALISRLCAQLERDDVRGDSMQVILNTAQLLARSPHNRSALLGEVRRIAGPVRRHMEDAGVQECALGLFGNLACSEGSSAILLDQGCLAHMLRCAQVHVEHAGVQRAVFRTIRNVATIGAAPSSACVRCFVEWCLPQHIGLSLAIHADDANVIEQALAASWALASLPSMGRLLLGTSTASGVVRAMGRHLDNAEVQRCSLGLLIELLDRDAEHRAILLRAPSRPWTREAEPFPAWSPQTDVPAPAEIASVALATAARYPMSEPVQLLVLHVMISITLSSRAPAVQQKQLSAILRHASAALAVFENVHDVELAAIELIGAAMPTRQSAIAVNSELQMAVLPLVKLLRRGNNATACDAACGLVARLAAFDSILPQLLRHDVVGSLISLLHKFNSGPVAAQALRALRCCLSLALSDDSQLEKASKAALSVLHQADLPDDITCSALSVLWSACATTAVTLPSTDTLRDVCLKRLSDTTCLDVCRQLVGVHAALSCHAEVATDIAASPWVDALASAACEDLLKDTGLLRCMATCTSNLLALRLERESPTLRQLAVAVAAALVATGQRSLPRALLRYRAVPYATSVATQVQEAASRAARARFTGGWTPETHHLCDEGLQRHAMRRLAIRVSLARGLPPIPYYIWANMVVARALVRPHYGAWHRLSAALLSGPQANAVAPGKRESSVVD